MLPLFLSASTGFSSFSNSGTAAACADSPDIVMKDMIGLTCAELKLMGKCDSSDELVASLMAKHCSASCTDCIPSRMTYSGGTNGGTMMCKEIEDGCDDPPIQCPVLEELAPAADFGLGDETSSYDSGFAAGEGVSGGYRLNWAKCCALAATQVDTGAFSSSSNSNVRHLETAIACMEHSSDTGTGGDCSTYSGFAAQSCCSHAVRDGYPDGGYDPMCVFDYCLNKLSPHS